VLLASFVLRRKDIKESVEASRSNFVSLFGTVCNFAFNRSFSSPLTYRMSDPEHSNATQLAGTGAANLYAVIDKDKVHGLNLSVPEDARAIIKPWDQREDDIYAESGVDDQVVFHIPFTQRVRIRSILLKTGRGEACPSHLRIYVNHASIVDFADAGSMKPQMDVTLLEDQTTVTEYPVRVTAFANVSTLSMLFSDSIGGNVSRIYYVGFRGDTTSPLREPGDRLDVRATNAPDASLVEKAAEKSARHTTIH